MNKLLEALEKRFAWDKAIPIPGYDHNDVRKDIYGLIIVYKEYGQLSKHGWELDHIWPQSRGGNDSISNLQALHWRSNKSKSDKPAEGLLGLLANRALF